MVRRRGLGVGLALLALAAGGCRRDMFVQPKSNPLQASAFFANGAASRPLPDHTISREHLDADREFYTGKVGTNDLAAIPVPVTMALLQRGRERFDINCSPCHGRTGEGNGMVALRGFPAPPTFHQERLRRAPIGHFFEVITHGYGVMYSYAQRVTPEDRWAIAAYIRALQLSHDARLQDAPPDERARLAAR